MSNPPQPTHLNILAQKITQYQQNIEFLNNNIAAIRQNIERPDISNEEKEALRKQEQEFQSKLIMLQTLISNLTPQMVAQNLQQRVLAQQLGNNQQQQQISSPTSNADNMSVSSTPGSPATFNPQQTQQHPNYAAVQAATQAIIAQHQQQQQLRTAQQQQQQQQVQHQQQVQQQVQASNQQQQVGQQQQQQALNKMGLTSQQGAFPSPINTANPQNKPNTGTNTNQVTNAAAAQAAVAAAAAAAVKNNGMFTFPTNQTPSVTTPGGSINIMTPVTGSNNIPVPKPVSVPSLDNDGVHRVLTKRKIQELVSQIDPSERLEPEVEDILLEIADEFIESVTTFACQLAKHRKSDTLEVKDVQLHLERNWNIRIPGFAADDIRSLRKPNIPSSHQSKIQAVNAAKSQLTSTSSKKDHSHNN